MESLYQEFIYKSRYSRYLPEQNRRENWEEHNLLGPEHALKRVKDGTHPFLNQPKIECPHCGKIGLLGAMKRWHFDNCKEKTS